MEKNKLLTLIGTLCLILALVAIPLAACAPKEPMPTPEPTPTPTPVKPIELSFSTLFPPTHYVVEEQHASWIQEVEEATGGRVKITLYPGNTLLGPAECYAGVVSGTADIGNSVFDYTRGRFPLMRAFELPGIYFGSSTVTGLIAWEGYKKFKPAELSDVKVMYIYSCGPGHLYTKKLVRSLEDLKGMTVRASGPMAEIIEALGATPIAMSQPEVYEALSKGVVDANISPPEVLLGFKQAEVTNYITIVPPIYNSIHFVVMNLDTWNSLPEEVQKAFDKVNDEFPLKAGRVWDAHQKEAMDYGVQEEGMQIIRLSPEEAARWLERVKPIQEAWVAEMESKGLPSREVLDFVIEKAAEYSEKYPAPIYEY